MKTTEVNKTKRFNLNVYVNPLAITVSAIAFDNRMIGAAETSVMMDGIDTYYFNRIYIQPYYRGKGFGSIILDRLLKEFSNKGINLICEVNPYGDLDEQQLISWYKRHGFIDNQDIEGTLIFKGNEGI